MIPPRGGEGRPGGALFYEDPGKGWTLSGLSDDAGEAEEINPGRRIEPDIEIFP
jgi:hypothetical protein